tara:strand:+ start:16066 stop:16491 length:426 start_codon:yes stop_codon:yes gene_type:complete
LDGTSRTAAVAGDEVETILSLRQTTCSVSILDRITFAENLLGVWRTARLAGDILNDVPPEDVLNLLLLEATLDDQPAVTSHGTARTQLSKQKLCDVFLGTLHPLADLCNVGEDGLLVAFTETLWWRDLVASSARVGEVGML